MSCLSLSKALLENVDRIGLSCFGSCQKLESLYFPHHHIVNFETDQVIADASSMFYGTPMVNSALTGNYGSIYVPAVLLSAYQNDLDWSPLSDRLVGLTDEQFQNIIDHWDD